MCSRPRTAPRPAAPRSRGCAPRTPTAPARRAFGGEGVVQQHKGVRTASNGEGQAGVQGAGAFACSRQWGRRLVETRSPPSLPLLWRAHLNSCSAWPEQSRRKPRRKAPNWRATLASSRCRAYRRAYSSLRLGAGFFGGEGGVLSVSRGAFCRFVSFDWCLIWKRKFGLVLVLFSWQVFVWLKRPASAFCHKSPFIFRVRLPGGGAGPGEPRAQGVRTGCPPSRRPPRRRASAPRPPPAPPPPGASGLWGCGGFGVLGLLG